MSADWVSIEIERHGSPYEGAGAATPDDEPPIDWDRREGEGWAVVGRTIEPVAGTDRQRYVTTFARAKGLLGKVLLIEQEFPGVPGRLRFAVRLQSPIERLEEIAAGKEGWREKELRRRLAEIEAQREWIEMEIRRREDIRNLSAPPP